MSKIGRKPINSSGIQVEVKGPEVHFKGPKKTGVYNLPEELTAAVADGQLTLEPNKTVGKKLKIRGLNRIWGLHRALLANEIAGAGKEFEKKVEITGLGYKAAQSGSKLVFTLGYSHKIDFPLPKDVVVTIDKSGQKLTVKSSNKELLGQVCSDMCLLRLTEPYKGTGVKLSTDIIIRKAGKTK